LPNTEHVLATSDKRSKVKGHRSRSPFHCICRCPSVCCPGL